jgi:hypothetical protein
MPPVWRFELVDRILRVDLTAGIEAGDFEVLYDGILAKMGEFDGVLIDLGDATLTGTGDFLLESLVSNLRRTRNVATSVLRRHPG